MKLYLKSISLILLIVLSSLIAGSQNVPLILDQPIGVGEYFNREKIIAAPDFVANPNGIDRVRLFIDPNIQLLHSYGTQNVSSTGINPVSRNLDYSLPVGTTPSTYQVTPTGALTYTVPISLPPGTMNKVPNLSVSYNSQSGQGILGTGWSLNGLTAINRGGKTIYHNNKVESVSFTNDDWFVLGGNKLIPTSGSNGQDLCVYATEMESYSRITSYGSVGNGPQWFKVETKDGTTIEIGNSVDSRLIPIGKSTILVWMVNKVYDNFGNYISFNYGNTNGELFIKEIKYTGNSDAGIAPYNTISFYYDIKSEPNKMFIDGGEINSTLILNSIKINCENTFYKMYKFNYAFYNVFTVLTEIEEYGSDSKKFNSLLFSYENDIGNPVESIPIMNYLPAQNGFVSSDYPIVKYFPLDYNGDGIKDLIAFYGQPYNASYGSYYYTALSWQRWSVLRNTGSNSFVEVSSVNGDVAGAFPPSFRPADLFPTNKSTISNMLFSSSDFNGDGKEDLVMTTVEEPNVTFNIHLADEDGLDETNPSNTFTENVKFTMWTPEQLTPIPSNSNNVSVWSVEEGHISATGNKFAIRMLDFDGDSKLDVLTYVDHSVNIPRSSTVKLRLNSAEDGNFISKLADTNFDFDRAIQFDIAGDGKTEIVNIYNHFATSQYPQGYYILKFDNGQVIYELDNSGTPPYLPPFSKTYFGDFNGDGISDMINCSAINDWMLKLGKGNGTIEIFQLNSIGLLNPFEQSSTPFSEDNYYFTQDINNDSKTDIIELIKDPLSNSTIINLYYSIGTSFVKNGSYQLSFVVNFRYDDLNFADFNGDGTQDMLIYTTEGRVAGNAPTIVYFYKGSNTRLLTEAVNGFNAKIIFEYQPIVQGSGLYTKNQTYAFPLNNIEGSLRLISNIKVPNGVGGTNETNYAYENGLLHRQGKGFLGFTKIIKTEPWLNTQETEEYELNSTYQTLLTKRTSIYNFANSSLLKDITFNHTFSPTQGTIGYRITPTDVVETDYIAGTNTASNFIYDLYGNLHHQEVNVNNGHEISVSDYTFIQAGSHIPSKVSNISINIKRQSEPWRSRSASFVYSSEGQLITEVKYPGMSKSVSTSYTYDASTGVLTSKTVSTAGQASRNIGYSYDPFFRFISKIQNPLGQFSEINFDPKWGTPIFTKGVDGIVTRNFLDGFGRKIRSSSSDNISETITYDWVEAGSVLGDDPLSIAQHIAYSATISSAGKPDMKMYFDFLGRSLQVEGDGFSNKIYRQVSYDDRGNIFRKTDNYETGSVNLVYETNYFSDLIFPNELIRCEKTDGTQTYASNYSHTTSSGNTTVNVVNPDGRLISKTIDPSGLVIASDDGGSVSYNYFSGGLLKETIVNGISINSITYDDFDHQTSLQDNNAGLSAYGYDAYGQLISQTDAKQNIYGDFQYDVLGRLISKKENNTGIYTYEYVASGNSGVNNIKSITGPNGIKYSYVYDKFNRIISYSEEGHHGQSILTTQYTYDENGNLLSTEYPGGITLSNEYNNSGFLTKIKFGAQIVWQADEVNSQGQFSKYTLGNGKQTQVTYDNFGFLKEQFTSGVEHLKYHFDPASGNLEWRKDEARNIMETFSYDQADRLTQSQINQMTYSVAYDSDGRINSKHDAGTYSDFASTHPHGVEKITDILSSAISHSEQNIAYTPFNSIAYISEGAYTLDLVYGPDHERRKTILKDNPSGNTISTKIFYPNYEKEIAGSYITEVYYIYSPIGLCAMYVKENGQGSIYYVYTDHIGSILKLTDASGNIVAEQSFDAWGKHRNPVNWTYDMTGAPLIPGWLDRGYTGHEHLPQFEIINMNGRCYDPIVGMMLSPDNYIQAPGNAQNYNRYSYCLNNPLKYTDPDGEVFVVPAIMIGFFVGAVATGYSGGDPGQIMTGAVIGGVAAGAGAYVGAAVAGGISYSGFLGGFVSGASGGFTSGFVGTSVSSWVNGASFHDGFVAGMTSGGYGALIGGVVGGVTKGFEALSSGKSFWDGQYSELYLQKHGIILTGGPVAETDLQEFVNNKFSERIDDMKHKPTISINDAKVGKFEAVTEPMMPLNKPGPSNIYLKSSVLTNDKILFYNLDHELTHAAHISNGLMASWARAFGFERAIKISEFYAYRGGLDVARSWQDYKLQRWTLNWMLHYKWK